MKSFFLYILILITILSCNTVNAQWQAGANIISFDLADSMLNHAVTIDTIHYHHNQWQIGKPHKPIFDSAYSLPNAIVTDTLYPYCPNDTSVFTIHCPQLITNAMGYPDIPMWIWFQYRLDTDAFTMIKIEFSKDTGSTWDTISWTNYSLPGPWVYAQANLSPFSLGGTFTAEDLIRYTFISGNDTMSKEGWMIDDIDIYYSWPEGVKVINNEQIFNVFPNPVHSSLNVTSLKTNSQISINNIFGQCVYSILCSTNKEEIDVSNLQNGLYFVEVINSDMGIKIVKKIFKE